MSGHDITNELRINWDENQSPKVPFYSASSGYTWAEIIEIVRIRAAAHDKKAQELYDWAHAYANLPEDQRRDCIPEPRKPKGRRL